MCNNICRGWVGLMLLAVLGLSSLVGCTTTPLTPDEGGDEYRILLEAYNGADHAQKAQRMKEFAEGEGFKNLSLVNQQSMTNLYMGHYGSVKQAEDDLKKAKEFRSARTGNRRVFGAARTVLMPGKDIGPAEWNLLNVDPQYKYTVVIMTFHDEGSYVGRRKIAVEACRQLRAQGEDAYFHHGLSNSNVCVGLFKINGVRTQKIPLENGAGFVEQRTAAPEVKALLKKYPNLQDNGRPLKVAVPTGGKPPVRVHGVIVSGEGERIGKLEEFYAPSYVIEIPKRPSARDPFAGAGNP